MRVLLTAAVTSLCLGCGASEEAEATPVDSMECQEGDWSLQNADSQIQWTGRKVTGSSHTGDFPEMSGCAQVRDGQALTGLIIQLDMNSLTSDKEKLTKHLKNADFFDVTNHPTAGYQLSSLSNGKLSGELEIRGTKQTVDAPLELTWSEGSLRIHGSTQINRTDWEVNHKSTLVGAVGDAVIEDMVDLQIDLNFKQP